VKWHDLTQSDNVEVDCLGERTPVESPEAAAAFACQAEVTRLRNDFTQGDPQREQQFGRALLLFIKDQDNQGSQSAPLPVTITDLLFNSRNLTNPGERPPNFDKLVQNFKRELDGFLVLADMEANAPKTQKSAKTPIPPQRTETEPEARVPLSPRL
jgi:hypothetical protein